MIPQSQLLGDLRCLWAMCRGGSGSTHAERIDHFYRTQARDYDSFRSRLLHGREEMFQSAADAIGAADGEPGPVKFWVDIGAGTGKSVELGRSLAKSAEQILLCDLSPALLSQARRFIRSSLSGKISCAIVDATTEFLRPESVDVVTFSYSLTMIPDWIAAIEQAYLALRPGGIIGIADFFVAAKYPESGQLRQSVFGRALWQTWFSLDDVILSPDHIRLLKRKFETVSLKQARGRIPYLPLARPPYYTFVGRKPDIIADELQ